MRISILTLLFAANAVFTHAQVHQYQSEPSSNPTSLLDIPTPPHDRNVEVYFSGESRPAKSYLHLKYLSAKKKGHDEMNLLVLELKKQAREAGADAIIVLETQKRVEQVTAGETYYDVDVADMNAIAVIYPENLKYIPGQTKTWNIYTPDKNDQSWQLTASQSFDFKGYPGAQTGKSHWLNWWRNASHEFLLQTPRILVRSVKDELGREKKRLLEDYRTVRIFYEKQGRTVKSIKTSKNDISDRTILYHYAEDGKTITHREIYQEQLPDIRYMEYPELDENGRLKAYLYVKQEGNKKDQFLRMEFVYYTEEDWNSHVKNLIHKELGE